MAGSSNGSILLAGIRMKIEVQGNWNSQRVPIPIPLGNCPISRSTLVLGGWKWKSFHIGFRCKSVSSKRRMALRA